MTFNDLMKLVPEDKRDYLILIYLPHKEDTDEIPLIEININDDKKQIIFESDWD